MMLNKDQNKIMEKNVNEKKRGGELDWIGLN